MSYNRRDSIDEDIKELSEQLKFFSRRELCEVLDSYIETVRKEQTDIGLGEYKVYIELLTEEINKYGRSQ